MPLMSPPAQNAFPPLEDDDSRVVSVGYFVERFLDTGFDAR